MGHTAACSRVIWKASLSGNVFLRLMRLARPFWKGMALSALLGTLTIASSVGLMATSAWMISKAGLQPSIADLGVSVVAVRFFGIARGVFRYLERLVSHDTTFRLLADMRVAFYSAIEPLAPARLSHYREGDLLGRVVADIEALQEVYLRVIAPPVVALLIALSVTALFAGFDRLVALVALVFMLLAGIGLPALAWWMAQRPGKKLVEARAELHTALVENIQGLAENLVYGAAQARLQELDALADSLAEQEMQFARLDGMQTAFGVLAVNGAALAVLAAAIPRVDGVYLATLALATIAAFEAVTPLAQAAQNWSVSRAAAVRLFEIADAEPAVVDAPRPSPQPDNGDLDIRHLTFRYAPDEPAVYEDFSLTISDGQKVAILGASGSGKSTLVNLLARFWDYEGGEIRLGGHDLREYPAEELRRWFGVISQRTYLFNTTIRENIRLAQPDASDEMITTAAQRAHIHDFITTLPDSYDTLVGENGAKLSGGQRQRIALARVLLRDAPIWVLDEATAHLDTTTEHAVLQTITEAAEGRTLIVIAHRLPLFITFDQTVTLHTDF
jgi:ATP-binding cassette subfamily C protein CydC